MRTLEQMLEVAAGHLPDGLEIEIRVEQGYGEVILYRDGLEECPAGKDGSLTEQLACILDHVGLGNRCEHGVEEGEYCEACNAEYKRAAAEHYGEET